MTKKTTKRKQPRRNAVTKKKTKIHHKETHSLQLKQELSQTTLKNKQVWVDISSGTCQTSKRNKDNDSTASSPEVKLPRKVYPLSAYDERKRKKGLLFPAVAPPSSSTLPDYRPRGYKPADDVLSDLELVEMRRSVLIRPEEEDDSDFYLNYHPSVMIGYEGADVNFSIPEWMPMAFKPTRAMNLNDLCAYTAAYIFQSDREELLGDEVLVRTATDVFADRKALKSLMPRQAVEREVINLVVARQNWMIETLGNKKSVWYMPMEFGQAALGEGKTADYLREMYKPNYMAQPEHVNRMFIPLKDGNHWYLMAIDFSDRKIVWLDSLHSEKRDHVRNRAILRMGLMVEEILMHESYDEEPMKCCLDRKVSEFSVYKPKQTQQQKQGSNDSGVWVAKWMIECAFRSDFGQITVNSATRMKLSLHLVKSKNNLLYNDVLAKAAEHWKTEQQKRDCLVKY